MPVSRRRFLTSALSASAAFSLNPSEVLANCQWTHTGPAPDLARDPRRPQYHLLPRSNWINDPNGPIYWNGMYHMFYQCNPDGICIEKMRWGHAISPDMLHWRHLPIALTPTPGGPDAEGCWSGTAVADRGGVTVLYTGVVNSSPEQATLMDGHVVYRESQCLAWSNDPELRTWTKLPSPVIPSPPPGMRVNGFRDPSPWRQGNMWYTVVGSGFPNQGGALLLYRSHDLRRWEYLHPVAEGKHLASTEANPVNSGDMWECPDLFPLGEKHVLIFSTRRQPHWQVGVLDPKEMRFHPEQEGILDYGAYYAPKTQLDVAGNRILWGWIVEWRPEAESSAAGWAGMMSLPRQLSLDNRGRLTMQMAPGTESLRMGQQTLSLTASEVQNQHQLKQMTVENVCGEILCVATPGQEPFHLTLTGRLDGQSELEWMTLTYDPARAGEVRIGKTSVPVTLNADGKLEIRMYVDGSVAEVILNQQAAFTQRFYYAGEMAPRTGVRVGSTRQLAALSMWQLRPISPDRLTR